MRTLKLLPILSLWVAVSANPSLVNAAESTAPTAASAVATPAATSASASASAPASGSPTLERLPDVEESAITISKPQTDNKTTEKRQQGKVTEVKVKKGKSTYYLKPNTPAGSALPGDAQSNSARAPQWKVMDFDLGKKKAAAATEGDNVPPPPLPISPAPATSKKQ